VDKTVVSTCPTCGHQESITGDDEEKWTSISSRVLGVTVHFKSQFVRAVCDYEISHWREHCIKSQRILRVVGKESKRSLF
jgi:hypothetical protein